MPLPPPAWETVLPFLNTGVFVSTRATVVLLSLMICLADFVFVPPPLPAISTAATAMIATRTTPPMTNGTTERRRPGGPGGAGRGGGPGGGAPGGGGPARGGGA